MFWLSVAIIAGGFFMWLGLTFALFVPWAGVMDLLVFSKGRARGVEGLVAVLPPAMVSFLVIAGTLPLLPLEVTI